MNYIVLALVVNQEHNADGKDQKGKDGTTCVSWLDYRMVHLDDDDETSPLCC
jgi:hypothetical protein